MSAEITRERSKVNFSLKDGDQIVSDGHEQYHSDISTTNGYITPPPPPLPHTHTHTP